MTELTTALLGRACRIFMERAYPSGLASIPPKKRPYYDMDPERPVCDYLPPSPTAAGIVQDLSARKECLRAYELRLGCGHFPNLKLRVQMMEWRGGPAWLFSVDTHDAFSRTSIQPPPDHPDAAGWLVLQEKNRQLKDRIEDDFEQAGFLTFKGLLRGDLETPVPVSKDHG